jgi:hypothetical protein
MQLMPAAMPGRAGRRGLCLAAGSGLEQREGRALRIGDNGEAADAGDVHGRTVDGAACLRGLGSGRVNVLDADVAHPARPCSGIAGLLGQRHRSGHIGTFSAEQGVGHAHHAGISSAPSKDMAVEGLRCPGVGGHELVPHETAQALGFRHRAASSADVALHDASIVDRYVDLNI